MTISEYTNTVPESFRGEWLLKWELKCPCHVAVFNCAAHFCSNKDSESHKQESEKNRKS